jgi:hypothetical protein
LQQLHVAVVAAVRQPLGYHIALKGAEFAHDWSPPYCPGGAANRMR